MVPHNLVNANYGTHVHAHLSLADTGLYRYSRRALADTGLYRYSRRGYSNHLLPFFSSSKNYQDSVKWLTLHTHVTVTLADTGLYRYSRRALADTGLYRYSRRGYSNHLLPFFSSSKNYQDSVKWLTLHTHVALYSLADTGLYRYSRRGQILRWWLGTGHVGKETTEITEKLLLQYFQLVTKPVLSGSAPPGSIARDPEYPLQDNYRSSIPYLDNIQVPHSTPLEELALF
ncbi:hypothetical protein J6590_104287 [Homalodisca vitripennis]|nr:hypothetical protein J6590_104287 [Homalodisca vitripennis]